MGKLSREEVSRRKNKILSLQRLKAKLTAEKGLRNLYFFNRNILERDSPDRQKNVVSHVHGEWWNWFQNSKKRDRLILVPRNSFKSTFFTVGFALQQLAKDHNVRILIANARLENAIKFLGDVKNAIRDNEAFKENYGELYDPKLKWTESEIEISGRSSRVREPSVMATGVGAGLAGMHFDWVLADDLVNEVNSTTREQSNKVVDWWERAMSLLDPKTGQSLTIGTRWAHYDLYQHIIDDLSDEVDTFVRSAYNKDGSLYFPEMLSEEFLAKQQIKQSSYTFSSFYLNDPVDEKSSLIKKHQIHYIGGNCHCGKTHVMPPREQLAVFTAIDPAASETTTADKSAFAVVGVDIEGNWWILEAVQGKWNIAELVSRMFENHKEYQNDVISLEVIGQATTLVAQIHETEIERNTFLPLKEVTSRFGIPKEARIRSQLQPRFERGKVFIPRGNIELESQLTRYPRSKHEDLLDCLSDIGEICFRPDRAIETREPEESSLQEQLMQQVERDKNPVFVDEVLGEYF